MHRNKVSLCAYFDSSNNKYPLVYNNSTIYSRTPWNKLVCCITQLVELNVTITTIYKNWMYSYIKLKHSILFIMTHRT